MRYTICIYLYIINNLKTKIENVVFKQFVLYIIYSLFKKLRRVTLSMKHDNSECENN